MIFSRISIQFNDSGSRRRGIHDLGVMFRVPSTQNGQKSSKFAGPSAHRRVRSLRSSLLKLFFPPPYPPPRRALGGQEAPIDPILEPSSSFPDVGETLLERLGAVLVGSWAVLGGSWATSAPSWAVLGSLGPSWGPLGLS